MAKKAKVANKKFKKYNFTAKRIIWISGEVEAADEDEATDKVQNLDCDYDDDDDNVEVEDIEEVEPEDDGCISH